MIRIGMDANVRQGPGQRIARTRRGCPAPAIGLVRSVRRCSKQPWRCPRPPAAAPGSRSRRTGTALQRRRCTCGSPRCAPPSSANEPPGEPAASPLRAATFLVQPRRCRRTRVGRRGPGGFAARGAIDEALKCGVSVRGHRRARSRRARASPELSQEPDRRRWICTGDPRAVSLQCYRHCSASFIGASSRFTLFKARRTCACCQFAQGPAHAVTPPPSSSRRE